MKRSNKVPLGIALGLTLCAGLLGPSANAATEPAPSPQADAPALKDFQLRPASNQAELTERVKLLDGKLPNKGVQALLREANRQGSAGGSGKACEPSAVAGDKKLNTESFCFNKGDSGYTDAGKQWYPQGVTTVADAQDDQKWGDSKPLLVGWYNKDKKGVRVTFIDSKTHKYQHVLLVYPQKPDSNDNPNYMTMRTKQTEDAGSLHAGGIKWYGNYLYVADTKRGYRVFDMRHILDLKEAKNGDTSDQNKVGREGGTYYGHGYRYVMPEVGAWTNTAGEADEDNGYGDNFKCGSEGPPHYSYVGLDRGGTDHLVTGEYCAEQKDGSGSEGRVAKWELDGETGCPKLSDGTAGCPEKNPKKNWHADEARRLPKYNIQGVVSSGDPKNQTWYLNQSAGENKNGSIYQASAETKGKLDVTGTHQGAIGGEDLSYWPGTGASADSLWTMTEHPEKRMLYHCTIPLPDNAGEICGKAG